MNTTTFTTFSRYHIICIRRLGQNPPQKMWKAPLRGVAVICYYYVVCIISLLTDCRNDPDRLGSWPPPSSSHGNLPSEVWHEVDPSSSPLLALTALILAQLPKADLPLVTSGPLTKFIRKPIRSGSSKKVAAVTPTASTSCPIPKVIASLPALTLRKLYTVIKHLFYSGSNICESCCWVVKSPIFCQKGRKPASSSDYSCWTRSACIQF